LSTITRFTPTRVGTAEGRVDAGAHVQVHPHACGDCEFRLVVAAGNGGSPPRVWGLQLFFEELPKLLRFTPTRVGTAHTLFGGTSDSAVHPHACGDCGGKSRTGWQVNGSPPRVWGLLAISVGLTESARFTPTRVGTARVSHTGSLPTTVHPHACGDCAGEPRNDAVNHGSPPRVWGLLDFANSWY